MYSSASKLQLQCVGADGELTAREFLDVGSASVGGFGDPLARQGFLEIGMLAIVGSAPHPRLWKKLCAVFLTRMRRPSSLDRHQAIADKHQKGLGVPRVSESKSCAEACDCLVRGMLPVGLLRQP